MSARVEGVDGTSREAAAPDRERDEAARTARALEAREARYRAIFEGAAVAIWEEDFTAVVAVLERLAADGVVDFRAYFAAHPERLGEAIGLVRVTDVNPAAARLFGASDRTELLASLHDIFLPEEQRVLDTRVEMSAVRADGTEFTVELSVTRIPTGGPPLFTAFLRDITARKQAEEALREADRRKDEFLATLSHALRNPLAPLRN